MYYQATATINGVTYESGFFFEGKDWACHMLVRQIGFENVDKVEIEAIPA